MTEVQQIGIACMILGATILVMGASTWLFGVLVK